MSSIGVPMARRGEGSITSKDPSQIPTSAGTLSHIQGVYGVPQDAVGVSGVQPSDNAECTHCVGTGADYMLWAAGIAPYTPLSAPPNLEHTL